MSEKKANKKKWLPIKEILFTYLAISKVLYWVETAGQMGQGDLSIAVNAVLMRMLDRDILLVATVIFFYFLDKLIMKKSKSGSIAKYIMLYVVGFVGMIGLFYIYIWILSWFFEIQIPPLGSLAGSMLIGYVVAIIVLNAKYYFKAKEKETIMEVLEEDDL